jgi:hypothetical protein
MLPMFQHSLKGDFTMGTGAGRGLVLGDLLGNLLGPLLSQNQGRDGQLQQQQSGIANRRSNQGGDLPAQVMQQRSGADGSTNFIIRAPGGSAQDAVMRGMLQRRGMDSGDIGYRGIRLQAQKDGDSYTFNINGNKKTIGGQALMNARGNELASLLGIGSFMEVMNSPQQGTADTKMGLQSPQPQGAQKPNKTQSGDGTAVKSGINQQAAPMPNTNFVQPAGTLPLQQIPGMMQQAPMAMQGAGLMQGQPMLGGVQGPGMPSQMMQGKNGKGGRGAAAGIPGYGYQDMFGNGAGTQAPYYGAEGVPNNVPLGSDISMYGI